MSEQQWKVVPAEPTEEMVSVFSEMLEAVDDGCSSSGKDLLRKFIATIAAAPQPPALGGEPDRDFHACRDQCSITPDDLVEMKRHQANAYMASMKILGLAEREYLPDAIRGIQSQYSACVRGRQAFRGALRKKRQEVARLQAEVERLRSALKFYADGDHLILADHDEWDTCSGEPINWLHDNAGTASVEDGSLAKQALTESAKSVGEHDWGHQGIPGTSFQALNAKANAGDL